MQARHDTPSGPTCKTKYKQLCYLEFVLHTEFQPCVVKAENSCSGQQQKFVIVGAS